MIKLSNKYTYNFVNSKFIKEIYNGSTKLLSFNTNLNYNTFPTDSQVNSYKYDFETGYFDSASGGNGYINILAPTAKLEVTAGTWNPSSTGQVLHIDFIDMLTGKQITSYYVIVSSKSGVRINYTFSVTKDGFVDQSTTWNTYVDAPVPYILYEYDFTNNKYIFRLLSGSDYKPSKVEYSIDMPYNGCKIQVTSTWSSSTSKFLFDKALIQR